MCVLYSQCSVVYSLCRFSLTIRQVCVCVYLAAMVQYSPQPSSSRGPTQGWSVSFVKSISGILKIVELVRIGLLHLHRRDETAC